MDPRRLGERWRERHSRRSADADGEAGVSTIEVVILAPILIAFIMIMVGLGIYADDVSQVQGAAQDAARIASLQRTQDAATSYALSTAATDMGSTCVPTVQQPLQEVSTGTVGQGAQVGAVQVLQVTVQCQVTVFGYTHVITAAAYAPVDNYRGGQP
jgi:Flp pilus assembly protein TadG